MKETLLNPNDFSKWGTWSDDTYFNGLVFKTENNKIHPIVQTVSERFAYFRKAYKDAHVDWDEYFAYTQREEKRLFAELNFAPDQLKENMKNESLS